MGQLFTDPKVQEDIERFTYKVMDCQDILKIVVNEKEMHPEEISGLILEKV